jgi:hypothetical protein
MKDVNQDTGEDVNPTSNNLLLGKTGTKNKLITIQIGQRPH